MKLNDLLSLLLLFSCFVFSSIAVTAQWGNDPVIVYDLTNGRGASQGFNVGEYRNDRGQLGGIGNDRASSVYVAEGFSVRICEAEGRGNGSGRCEQYGAGYHNLMYSNTMSYIQVSGNGSGWGGNGGNWGGNNNGIGGNGVTVYDDRDYRGASQKFGPGRYLNSGGGLGAIRNDEASSVIVERGYKVRFCESEGGGNGAGKCEEYGEGRYNIRLNDEASYIEVTRTGGGWGGGNGGWGGNGGSGGGWGGGSGNGGNNNGNRVIVYSEKDQRGDEQSFSTGTFRNDRGQLGNIRNDDATSIFVPRGYRARVCEKEGGYNGAGRCEEYGPGSYNLRYNDEMSFIRVWRTF